MGFEGDMKHDRDGIIDSLVTWNRTLRCNTSLQYQVHNYRRRQSSGTVSRDRFRRKMRDGVRLAILSGRYLTKVNFAVLPESSSTNHRYHIHSQGQKK